MAGFRALLIVIFVVICAYTALVVADHGLNLFAVFFGDMTRLGWPGQFNLDFMFMLTLSALWVAWRHEFSGAGLALAGLAFIGGATFLSVYLFVVTGQAKGDMRVVLLGGKRAAGAATPR